MNSLRPFHIALIVDDIDEARHFYGDLLGCAEGRSDIDWVDFDLYGHQFVCHRIDGVRKASDDNPHENIVDNQSVPLPHCGVVLTMEDWQVLADRVAASGIAFIVEPCIRFLGQPGEQATFFIQDPSGNALEFKGLNDLNRLFSS